MQPCDWVCSAHNHRVLPKHRALKEAERKTPGYQRLRMAQYDDLRKKLISSHGTRALKGEVSIFIYTKNKKNPLQTSPLSTKTAAAHRWTQEL